LIILKLKIMQYIGIDWGTNRIGLALGDSEIKMASPYKTAASLNDVLKIIKQEKIDEIILGLPLKFDGDKIQVKFSQFKTALEALAGLPVILVDERLTSKAADNLPGLKKEKAGRDEIAAMLILQTFFDKN